MAKRLAIVGVLITVVLNMLWLPGSKEAYAQESNALFLPFVGIGPFQNDPGGADVPAAIWPMPDWVVATPEEMHMDSAMLERAKAYALTGGGSGYITRYGRLVMAWGDPKARYDIKSSTKSVAATALGLAIGDRKVALDDRVQSHYSGFGLPPDENAESGWLDDITIHHLATHTAGFEQDGGYNLLLFAPGTEWAYSSSGTNWLAEMLTVVYQQDLYELTWERVFSKLGIRAAQLAWRDNVYRADTIDGIKSREFASGILISVDAMARIGYLYLREGAWQDERLIPAEFVRQVGVTPEQLAGLPVRRAAHYGDAPNHYGLLWWNNNDGTMARIPRDAYWAWGLGDSIILVIPSLDIVAVRAGSAWALEGEVSNAGLSETDLWTADFRLLEPFFEPIVASVQ